MSSGDPGRHRGSFLDGHRLKAKHRSADATENEKGEQMGTRIWRSANSYSVPDEWNNLRWTSGRDIARMNVWMRGEEVRADVLPGC